MVQATEQYKAFRINEIGTVQHPGARQIAHKFPENSQKVSGKFPGIFERQVNDMDEYCDRQGCLNTDGRTEKLPDGCEVKVCSEHRPFFQHDPITGTHDREANGVYWHRCNLLPSTNLYPSTLVRS